MFSIGEFSRICQASIKTLRYYDRIGLMPPARVDEVTGYRYYSRSQMETMLLIQRLKRYDFTLEEIGRILNCTDESALFSKLRQQEEKLKKRQREMDAVLCDLSSHLEDFERTGDIMGYQKNYEVELKEMPERSVLACRRRMGVEEFGRYYSTLFERVPKEKVTPNGVVGAVYYDEEFHRESSDIELIVGIREREKADKTMPSGLCAVTLHKGGYSSLPDAYGALVKWIEIHNYHWAGEPYEIYVKSHVDTPDPQEWITEICFPVKKDI